VGDLLVDERCRPALLDYLRSIYVGRVAPPVEATWDSNDKEQQQTMTAERVMDEEEETAE